MAFSQDDQEILTVASDHTARIWEAHSGAPLTEPTRYDGAFTRRSAQFSAGDKRILTVWNHNTVRVIDVMPSEKKLPSWVPELTDAMAGQRLSNRGFFEPLSKDSTQLFSDVREQLSHEPAEDEWAIWGRWFLADRSTRTISPFSKITVPEYIEDRIKENTAESLDEAEQLAVGNPELLRRIRLAKESLPPKAEQKEKEQQENH